MSRIVLCVVFWLLFSIQECFKTNSIRTTVASAAATTPTTTTTELVLVTGANGYIGSSLIQELLRQGYQVRGTVRDIHNQEKITTLQSFPNAGTHLELVQWTLEEPDGNLMAIVKDVQWIFHTAGTTASWEEDAINTKEEHLAVQPSVKAIHSLLRAAHVTESVTKFIYTSSMAAVTKGHSFNRTDPFTEMDWSIIEQQQQDAASNPPKNPCDAYCRTKTLTEQVVWQYVGLHQPPFTVSTIVPGVVIGPIPSSSYANSSSGRMFLRLVNGKSDDGGGGRNTLPFVDIRDVVTAHIQAAKLSMEGGGAVNNKRFFVLPTNDPPSDITTLVRDTLESLGYKTTTNLSSSSSDDTANPVTNNNWRFTNQQSIDILGLTYTPTNETIVDSIHSMIQCGLIDKTVDYSKQTREHQEL